MWDNWHMKKIFSILFLVAILIGVGVLLSRDRKKEPTVAGEKTAKITEPVKTDQVQTEKKETNAILFYGDGCPYCANVEKFVKENNVDKKLTYAKKEVWSNEANSKEMVAYAKKCGFGEDQIGVPFMWTGEKCLVGEDEVINFFKEQAGIK